MSIIELKLLTVVLMLTNMWSIFRILEGYWIPKCIKRRWNSFWQQQRDKWMLKLRWLIREEPVRNKPLEDVMGKSLFKMPHVIAAEQERKCKEILASGVDVLTYDVMFKATDEQMGVQKSRSKHVQVPNSELDKTFTDNRVSSMDEDADYGQADGSTFEDIDTAVVTVKKRNPTLKEEEHAGKVFYKMEDNELFVKLTESQAMFERIRNVIDKHLDRVANVSKATHLQDDVLKFEPFERISVPDNIEDFDIRNYV